MRGHPLDYDNWSTKYGLKEWSFLCGKCLTEIKAEHEKTYQYGGTWKRKKR